MSAIDTRIIDGQTCRRHGNPDGSEGGWVAEAAQVASTAHIGYYATVLGHAKVCGDASLLGYAKVCGAIIHDHIVICDIEIFGLTGVPENNVAVIAVSRSD